MLGLDAASPHLLRRWAGEGRLPHIRSLMDRGLTGDIRGLDGFFVGSTWPSFYTGRSPAGHGLHYLVQIRPGTYDYYKPADGTLVKADPFWLRMDAAGVRTLVIDVPLTRLDRLVHGRQVVEWGSHDPLYGFRTEPADLGKRIMTRWGPHPVGSRCDAPDRGPDEYRGFRDALIRGIRARTELTLEFLQQADWDFTIQVFSEAHCAGHQCWHLHDPSHPAYDATLAAAAGGDTLLQVYEALDDSIGRLLAAVPDATVFLIAGHGMGAWYGAQFLLQEILFRLGAAARPDPAPRRSPTLRSAAISAARTVWERIPAGLRTWLAPVRQRLGPRPHTSWSLGVEPSQSRCFVVGNGFPVGGIRLNLAGREPAGVLQPGADADHFSETLIEQLLAIVDDRTGHAAIQQVRRTRDLYQGPCLDALPDLLIEWSDEIATGSTAVHQGAGARVTLRSAAIGRLTGANSYARTGDHRRDGLYVVAGSGIPAGRDGAPVGLMDFAPTFECLAGLTPATGDGAPIPALCGPAPS